MQRLKWHSSVLELLGLLLAKLHGWNFAPWKKWTNKGLRKRPRTKKREPNFRKCWQLVLLNEHSQNTLTSKELFQIHVCLSFLFVLCVRKLAQIPAFVYITKWHQQKSYLICVKRENVHSGSPSNPWGKASWYAYRIGSIRAPFLNRTPPLRNHAKMQFLYVFYVTIWGKKLVLKNRTPGFK